MEQLEMHGVPREQLRYMQTVVTLVANANNPQVAKRVREIVRPE